MADQAEVVATIYLTVYPLSEILSPCVLDGLKEILPDAQIDGQVSQYQTTNIDAELQSNKPCLKL